MSAARRLARALEASARAAGCRVTLSGGHEQPWASPTFVGARHELRIEGDASPAFATWLAGLAEAELSLPGHLLAEIRVEATEPLRLHALTLVAQ